MNVTKNDIVDTYRYTVNSSPCSRQHKPITLLILALKAIIRIIPQRDQIVNVTLTNAPYWKYKIAYFNVSCLRTRSLIGFTVSYSFNF